MSASASYPLASSSSSSLFSLLDGSNILVPVRSNACCTLLESHTLHIRTSFQRAVQCLVPTALRIHDVFAHVAVYFASEGEEDWTYSKIAGPAFLIECKSRQRCLLVLNRRENHCAVFTFPPARGYSPVAFARAKSKAVVKKPIFSQLQVHEELFASLRADLLALPPPQLVPFDYSSIGQASSHRVPPRHSNPSVRTARTRKSTSRNSPADFLPPLLQANDPCGGACKCGVGLFPPVSPESEGTAEADSGSPSPGPQAGMVAGICARNGPVLTPSRSRLLMFAAPPKGVTFNTESTVAGTPRSFPDAYALWTPFAHDVHRLHLALACLHYATPLQPYHAFFSCPKPCGRFPHDGTVETIEPAPFADATAYDREVEEFIRAAGDFLSSDELEAACAQRSLTKAAAAASQRMQYWTSQLSPFLASHQTGQAPASQVTPAAGVSPSPSQGQLVHIPSVTAALVAAQHQAQRAAARRSGSGPGPGDASGPGVPSTVPPGDEPSSEEALLDMPGRVPTKGRDADSRLISPRQSVTYRPSSRHPGPGAGATAAAGGGLQQPRKHAKPKKKKQTKDAPPAGVAAGAGAAAPRKKPHKSGGRPSSE
ncbi:hypothetical protein H696_01415 [Fonticula alba]|uniref:Uncharacterized protein n=1 Tax=Fonticula alba TaxID=691883 RepID=A0A058ZDK8_FONAL|nr:hypothetical protein H696_01415 [Fonticula alba]KCV72008.1 hypothetical protein H696_01415 [Fonticula alba]|eukprot:XP_009493586.1 hypothetical protein H696_01415 [Fonticula alba]